MQLLLVRNIRWNNLYINLLVSQKLFSQTGVHMNYCTDTKLTVVMWSIIKQLIMIDNFAN